MSEQPDLFTPMPQFDGATYIPIFDYERLGKQMRAVYDVVIDGCWRTLPEISDITGYPQQSISARLRDLRKAKFGGHIVERRHRGAREHGHYEYRVMRNDA